jgi:hypothetical protein
MSALRVGMRVVCVDDSGFVPLLKKGKTYTVIALFGELTGSPDFIQIDERANALPGGNSWGRRRFRPVRDTDISVFTAMLAPAPERVGEDA